MKTVKGDLIKLAEQGVFDLIVQGCNCFHTQSSGLAGQLASKYPQVLEADKTQSKYGDKEKLGKSTEVNIEVGETTFIVINVYTQYFFGLGKDVFEYDAFREFLNNYAATITSAIWIYPDKINIGFPMIGAGLAGGDWSRISKMIEDFSEEVKDFADVTVVEYQP